MPTTPPKPQDFDIFAEIMTQLRILNQKIDHQATKEDLQNYVLQAVFDVTITALKARDEDQQKNLDDLENRVMTQGQRFFQYGCAAVGAIGGLLAIIHYFIK